MAVEVLDPATVLVGGHHSSICRVMVEEGQQVRCTEVGETIVDFALLQDGTVIVKEIEGNHPACTEHGRYYPAGRYAIIKSGDHMEIVFLKTEEEKEQNKPASGE